MMKIDGGCHCGRVTYEAEVDPADVSICHCTDCQTLTGSACRVSVHASRERFRLTGAAPRLYVKIADSGSRRLQYFCPDCGTPIYAAGESKAEGEAAGECAIRWGSIRQRRELAPKRQIWCRSALPWINDLAALPGRSAD
jgi:hypothetical protein